MGGAGVDGERALAWAQAERERAAVVRLAADLAAVDVEALVFKGIHLAFAVAPNPDFRLCLDADVLVLGGAFERAAARLRALERWTLHDANWSTYGATLVETGAYVDLHRMPLPPSFGRFDVAGLRARARLRPELFGPALWVPDALDAAALAIAHYVKDMLGAVGHGKITVDLELLDANAGLDPRALAERLASHGLRRAGLLAFADLAAADPRWRPHRDACARSTLERRSLELMAQGVGALAERSERLAFLAVRGLADRPLDGAASAALAAARLARDALFR
jgi:hypothetical protein